MKAEFTLKKMPVQAGEPVQYFLDLGADFLQLNKLLDKEISLEHTGYECLACGSDEPIYARGFCKKCFFEAPQAAAWFIHPEQSKAHLGIEDRDLAYEQQIQLAPHVVYLAKTSGIKVGVTRRANIPDRWIDQGADEAMVVLEVPNRYLAGITEVALKAHINDKTQWKGMLSARVAPDDLHRVWAGLQAFVPAETRQYVVSSPGVHRFTYPVNRYPAQFKAVKLDKEKRISGRLAGIKGQYLIFDDGRVFNVRNHEGYRVLLEL